MASQYKNLFFDLDDTLWAFSLNARDTFEEMYHKYDYGRFFRSFLHFYTLYQHRNTELWEEYGRGQVSKEELNRQRFLYPLEAVGARDVALAEAFSDDFFSVIPTKNRLMPHAYEVLEYLGFVIGIIGLEMERDLCKMYLMKFLNLVNLIFLFV